MQSPEFTVLGHAQNKPSWPTLEQTSLISLASLAAAKHTAYMKMKEARLPADKFYEKLCRFSPQDV
jgi:hypothetical protein